MTTLVLSRARALLHRPTVVLSALAVLVGIAALLSLGLGALAVPPSDALAVVGSHLLPGLVEPVSGAADAVVWQIRVPRTLLGLVIGAGLAVAGALFQGLFRNPLADPGLLGITAGAAAAVALAILAAGGLTTALGGSLAWLAPIRPYLVPAAAVTGSFLTLMAVIPLGGGARLDIATLLLAGIAVNAIAGAVTGLAIFLADDAQLRDLTFWTLGALGGATWPVSLVTAAAILPALAVTPFLARRLDALLLGEADAYHTGVPVESTKRWIVGLGALLVGASVAAAGAIGFVGLVVPHLIRLVLGPGHRLLLPAAALLGAGGLVLADVLARTVVSPAELPIGVLTTLLGGPFFLFLLILRRRRMG